MASKLTVTLPDEWIVRSTDYANNVVNGYGEGRNAASRAVSSHGAHENNDLQAHARMGECAAAMVFGLDPASALNWTDRCDPGWDFIAHGARWDVKATPTGRFLIWPINKRHIFASKQFDTLVLVRGICPVFVVVGFTLKTIFEREHRVAGVGHCLDPGTWHMHEKELWPIT